MKKIFLVINVLLIYIFFFAKPVIVSGDTLSNEKYKDNNVDIEVSADVENYNQIEQPTNTIITIQKSTNTINTPTKTVDIARPLKYKEIKSNNIEISSTTVIPDENELGTYFSSGAIVETAKTETAKKEPVKKETAEKNTAKKEEA